MQSFPKVLERYDRLWEQAEDYIEAYFARHRAPVPSGGNHREHKPPAPVLWKDSKGLEIAVPDLKELNTAVTILKRIQDARRAIHLDAMKWEAATPDGPKPDAVDPEKISRIIRRLEQNGNGGESLEDDADAV